MGEGREQVLQASGSITEGENQWMVMEGDNHETSFSSSDLDNSRTSNESTSSSDMVDDASSSTSCSSSNSNGPLYELSELMAHLPIKRGLSQYYQGMSQSFTSLSRVASVEDLVKKKTPYKRKMKASKSYGNGLEIHKSYTVPKPIISKKVSRNSLPGRRGSFLNNCRPPPVPVQKKF